MNNIFFTISSLIYIIMLLIVYLRRKKNNNITNKIYFWLIISSIIGLLIELFKYLLISYWHVGYDSSVFIFSIKLILLYFIAWTIIFTLYMWIISVDTPAQKRRFKRGVLVSGIIFLCLELIVLIVPITIVSVGNETFIPKGISVTISYLITYVCTFAIGFSLYMGKKSFMNIKYVPLYCFVTFGVIELIFQGLIPGLYLITSLEVYTTFTIYFTLENPDLRMVEEFKKTKEYALSSNKEKELFLFNITKKLKTPLINIDDICSELKVVKDNDSIAEGADYISTENKIMYNSLNKMIDVTNLDVCDIKVHNANYKPLILIDELALMYKNKVNKDVKFKIVMDDTLPNILYGDYIRMKQVLKIVLENSCKYTKKGTITFSVTNKVKLNSCRLIIKITDTGVGMTNYEMSRVFNKYDGDEVFDETRSNLANAKTIASLMGGLLVITSELDVGSTFTLIVDQDIIEK